MQNVISLTHREELVETSKFPHLNFKYEKFNPVQSAFYEIVESDANIIVASTTSSGKTLMAEMALAYEVKKRGGRGMYISPQKALSQEKINDWTAEQHGFSKYNLSICTGDYKVTKDRADELQAANLFLMTIEMLDSKCRIIGGSRVEWLREVGTLVTDELHKIGSEGRGDKLEVALMRMSAINPNIRHIGLSATIPNAENLAEWFCKLTGRDTYVLRSDFRPCPLFIHYPAYNDKQWKYDMKQLEIVSSALDLVRKYKDDKFLIFSHSLRTGELMKRMLLDDGIDADFHNGRLGPAVRHKLEDRFRNDPKFRVLVATSTLSAGVNTPARRAIILGVHQGLQEVGVDEIHQQIGRTGRPGYDPQGDAYILLPRSDYHNQKRRIEHMPPCSSQLMPMGSDDHRRLAFHVVNEICQGGVSTVDDIRNWYARTLACHQRHRLEEHIIEQMLAKLERRGVIKNVDGNLEATPLGKISSLFYFSPYDVADWAINFTNMFRANKQLDDYWISASLAKVDSNRIGSVSAMEAEHMAEFAIRFRSAVPNAMRDFSPAAMKAAYCYHCMLTGRVDGHFDSVIGAMRQDVGRTMEVLNALDGMGLKWGQAQYLTKLRQKINNGVAWSLLDLCDVKGVGSVKARKLFDAGIKTASDIVRSPQLAKMALGCSDKALNTLVENSKAVINGPAVAV